MKTTILLLVMVLFLTSCQEDDFIDCGCKKYTQLKNGDFLHSEEVECQPELLYGKDEQNRIYFIKCD